MRQERAEQTRRALIAAAGAEFDRHGYAGTSLARISATAGVTMGALTFHFPSKAGLADAVQAAGAATTRAALCRLAAQPVPALQSVIDLTHALAQLLAETVGVRAASRLSRERPGTCVTWRSLWLPALQDALARADAEHGPHAGLKDLETLVVYLVSGAEEVIRAGGQSAGVRDQLTRIWAVALAGTPAPAARSALTPAGSGA
ncbi:TetR family transcriptional regulator [Streptomyces sp. NPDC048483]|uniref:TetR family transcriptional regulator n=1 Tax=Streptomyces sp. NPDC048483 TaxID=3154927 RepID=UPI0034382EF5